MSALDDVEMELLGAKAEREPIAEGLKNFAAEDVSALAKAALAALETPWRQQLTLIDAVLQAVQALRDSNYPDMPSAQIPPEVYHEMVAHHIENEAAFLVLEPEPPVVLPQPVSIVGGVEA